LGIVDLIDGCYTVNALLLNCAEISDSCCFCVSRL